MLAQRQTAPQQDDQQLIMEAERDAIRFDHWLNTPEGQRWLDTEEQEELARRCVACWEV